MALTERFWLAFVAWFRVLLDADFAQRVQQARSPQPAPLPEKPKREPAQAPPPAKVDSGPGPAEGALQLLGLLQREGRLIDFVQQDITTFGDADVGAAARVVHEGCRRALRSHASIDSVRDEKEGTSITVEQADLAGVKLTGNVAGDAPYRGVLRHRGWRLQNLKLPTLVGERDLSVVAQAEVEL
jgi:hypothetical protein